MHIQHLIAAFSLVGAAVAAFGQPVPGQPDDAFQVNYLTNPACVSRLGDSSTVLCAAAPIPLLSVVNIVNAGSSASAVAPVRAGNMCANVYVFDASDEQMIACCFCGLTPNQASSMTWADLTSNTLTPGIPVRGITVKIVGTTTTAGCNPSNPTSATLASGLRAWATHVHPTPGLKPTETEFQPATLSVPELTQLTSFCGFIQSNGSGFGICRCRGGAQ